METLARDVKVFACRVGCHLQLICDPPRSPGLLYERIRNTLNLFNGIRKVREKRIVAILDRSLRGCRSD